MRVIAPAASLVVLVGAIIGTVVDDAPMPNRQGESPSPILPGGTIWAGAPDLEFSTRPLIAELGAFRRKRKESDILTSQAEAELREFALEASAAGQDLDPLFDDSRRLLRDQASGIAIYAIPTRSGAVCYTISHTLGSGCERHLTKAGVTVALSQTTGGPVKIFGFADSTIDDVVAVAANKEYPAIMGDGVYLIRLPSRISLNELALRTRRHDGTERLISLAR